MKKSRFSNSQILAIRYPLSVIVRDSNILIWANNSIPAVIFTNI